MSSAHTLRWIFGIGCSVLALLFLGLLSLLIFVGAKGPETFVVEGHHMKAKHLKRLEELGVLETDEKILLFYSDGLLDIADGSYLLTDRHLIVYCDAWEQPLEKYPYSQVVDATLERDESFFTDSHLTVTLAEGFETSFPLSSEKNGDERFLEKLEEQMEIARSSPLE